MVPYPASLNPVVPRGGNLVNLAPAVVAMRGLPALGNALQIHIESHARIGSEMRHQVLPLEAVGLYPTTRVDFVHDKMSDLVGYGVAQVFLEVLGKYPGVVADKPTLTNGLEHARGAALQVKEYRHPVKTAVKQTLRATDVVFRRLLDLFPLRKPDGLDHDTPSLFIIGLLYCLSMLHIQRQQSPGIIAVVMEVELHLLSCCRVHRRGNSHIVNTAGVGYCNFLLKYHLATD